MGRGRCAPEIGFRLATLTPPKTRSTRFPASRYVALAYAAADRYLIRRTLNPTRRLAPIRSGGLASRGGKRSRHAVQRQTRTREKAVMNREVEPVREHGRPDRPARPRHRSAFRRAEPLDGARCQTPECPARTRLWRLLLLFLRSRNIQTTAASRFGFRSICDDTPTWYACGAFYGRW